MLFGCSFYSCFSKGHAWNNSILPCHPHCLFSGPGINHGFPIWTQTFQWSQEVNENDCRSNLIKGITWKLKCNGSSFSHADFFHFLEKIIFYFLRNNKNKKSFDLYTVNGTLCFLVYFFAHFCWYKRHGIQFHYALSLPYSIAVCVNSPELSIIELFCVIKISRKQFSCHSVLQFNWICPLSHASNGNLRKWSEEGLFLLYYRPLSLFSSQSSVSSFTVPNSSPFIFTPRDFPKPFSRFTVELSSGKSAHKLVEILRKKKRFIPGGEPKRWPHESIGLSMLWWVELIMIMEIPYLHFECSLVTLTDAE